MIHYDVFSRLITELANQLLGTPLLIFFDDFAAIAKRLLVDSALVAFSEFCALLGIKMEETKSEAGPNVTFSGLRASCPSLSNDFELSGRLGEAKRTARVALFGRSGKTKSTARQEMGKLMGRLSPPQAIFVGGFPRAQLRPLYKKTHRAFYFANLSRLEISTLSWRKVIPASMDARILSPRPARIRWIAYADAATASSLFRALLFDTSAPHPAIRCCWTARPPQVGATFSGILLAF